METQQKAQQETIQKTTQKTLLSEQQAGERIPKTSFHAQTQTEIAQPTLIQPFLIEALGDFGEILHQDDTRLVFKVDLGFIDTTIDGTVLRLTISSHSAETLHMLREAVNHYTEEHMKLAPLLWSDKADIKAGELPPNCRLATVLKADWFSHRYIRITLYAENLENYAHVGLHFRACLPKPNRQPVWPYLSSEGKSVWPKGEDKLHTPVYTTVSVSPEKNELVFDVYAHDNGDTCAWAHALVEGTETRKDILISGPSGGWIPPRKKLIIAGDETALPAIRRTIEATQSDDQVIAFIEMESPEDFIPISFTKDDAPPHFMPKSGEVHSDNKEASSSITFLARSKGQSAKQALLNLGSNTYEDCYVWFAGEKDDASEVRETVANVWKIPRNKKYIAAYWTRGASTTL